jgi:hypothetical protein
MRWLFCACLIALPLVAAADSGRGIRVLAGAADQRRATVLVDALRIYTRDLGRTVALGGAPPTALTAEQLEPIGDAALAAGDEVVVWFGELDGAPLLYAYRASTGELRQTPVEPDEPLRSARALALKVRALIAARSDEHQWSAPAATPPPPPPPAPSAAPPSTESGPESVRPTPPPPAPSPPAATPPPPVPTSVQRSAAPPRRNWLDATVAYGVTVPTQTAWIRHGLTLRLALPWGRLPLTAFVDAAFTSAPTTVVDGNPVTARIWPVGIGVGLRLRRPRWQLVIAPRASLQIVDAAASASDGRNGAAQRYAAGLGALAETTWMFSRWVGATGAVTAEALVPRLAFAAGGMSSTDLGWVQVGFAAGLLFSLP